MNPEPTPLRIGTRGSRLALWQAHHVRDRLAAGGWPATIVPIATTGDQVLDRSLAKIGSKGLFTQELEDQLLDGRIDLAVHSAKDLPSELPDTLELIAFTERERVNDVLVSLQPDLDPTAGEPFVVGTSSTRRVAMLRHFYPHLRSVDMRGNLQTRLRKLAEGTCDALLLAYAGVVRMGFTDRIVAYLPADAFTPAAGQGSIAVEAAVTLAPDRRAAVRQLVNHPDTEACVRAERAFLRRLQGGCSVPVFALATQQPGNQPGELVLTGGLISLDGQQLLRETHVGADADALGEAVAARILARGGGQILADIKGTAQ